MLLSLRTGLCEASIWDRLGGLFEAFVGGFLTYRLGDSCLILRGLAVLTAMAFGVGEFRVFIVVFTAKSEGDFVTDIPSLTRHDVAAAYVALAVMQIEQTGSFLLGAALAGGHWAAIGLNSALATSASFMASLIVGRRSHGSHSSA